jgi:hypothetical protein
VSQYKQDGNFSQLSQRTVGAIFRDQHGRRYHATIEKRTGHPCGLIEPQFQAPLMPPQMYLKVGTNPERPYDMPIDYESWERDARAQHTEWTDAARKISRHLYQDKYNPNEPFTREVRDLMGDAGQPVEPIIAARQGNAWVLGFTEQVDVRLAKFFEFRKTAEQRRANEPDFSEVVTELEPEFDAIEEEAERQREATRARERDKKRRQRAAKLAIPVEG